MRGSARADRVRRLRARRFQTPLPAWEFILGFSRRSAWRWAALAWCACRLLDSCASCARLCGRMLELLVCARSREVCFACVRRTHAWVHIARGGNGDLSTCVLRQHATGRQTLAALARVRGMTDLLPRVRRARACLRGRMLGSLACARSRVACFACARRSHAWLHIAGSGNIVLSTRVRRQRARGRQLTR